MSNKENKQVIKDNSIIEFISYCNNNKVIVNDITNTDSFINSNINFYDNKQYYYLKYCDNLFIHECIIYYEIRTTSYHIIEYNYNKSLNKDDILTKLSGYQPNFWHLEELKQSLIKSINYKFSDQSCHSKERTFYKLDKDLNSNCDFKETIARSVLNRFFVDGKKY